MTWAIHHADVRVGLAALDPGSVQCCVTSPPYWGLRAYGTDPQVWGGAPDCAHAWLPGSRRGQTGGTASPKVQIKGLANYSVTPDSTYQDCARCGAWRGELGSEPTPDAYVAHLVAVFAAVRRVLRPDGTLWINLGDAYSGSGKGPTGHNGIGDQERRQGFTGHRSGGLPAKSLCLIPERFALAMQAAGWIVRSRIAWCKTSVMPESVRDRPTSAWEHIFLFTRQARYYYDAEAVAERSVSDHSSGNGYARPEQLSRGGPGSEQPWAPQPTRNLRNYWVLGPELYSGAHFATFPPEIPRRCILAGSRPGDLVCDPFAGAGTTGLVADRLGRDFVGIELSAAYVALARARIASDAPLVAAIDATPVPINLPLEGFV